MPKKIIAIHVAIEVMVAGQRLDTAGFAGVGETNAIPPVPVRGWILGREGKEPPPTGVGDRSLVINRYSWRIMNMESNSIHIQLDRVLVERVTYRKRDLGIVSTTERQFHMERVLPIWPAQRYPAWELEFTDPISRVPCRVPLFIPRKPPGIFGYFLCPVGYFVASEGETN